MESVLFDKLKLRWQKNICLFNAPESFKAEEANLAADIHVFKQMDRVIEIDFVLLFVKQKQQFETQFPAIAQKLQGDAVVWICYPKGTSKLYKSDIHRDHGWELMQANDMLAVSAVSIDKDWTALRFRKQSYIKKLTRKW